MDPINYKKKQADILVNLLSSRKYEDVIRKAKPLIKKFPKDYIFYNAVGMALISLEKYDDALKILNQAMKLGENNIFVLNNLGLAHHFLKNFETAEACFNRILKIKKDYLHTFINYANLKKFLHLNTEALKILKTAEKYHPNNFLLHHNIANLYQVMGDFKNCNLYFEKSLALNPSFTINDRLISMSKKYKKKDDKHLEYLKKKVSNEKFNEGQKMHLYFALGKAYDDLDDFYNSFANYKKANDIQNKLQKYDLKLEKDILLNIKKHFSLDKFELNKPTNKKIIFIVGMTRSGTSLIEQVLSSHDKVYGAGELSFLTEAINNLFLPKNLPNSEFTINTINKDNLNYIKKYYEDNINKFNFSEEYIIDKAPLNFRFIGFIRKSFPNSYIIHCDRDPLDICWSNYKQCFSAKIMGFSYNLTNLGNFYNLYKEYMNYWKKLYDKKIYNLNYENFTNNFEQEAKKLLSFCELDWDPKCIEFYKNSKSVTTASLAQVRQPIYKSSISSSRNYSDYLNELINIINK